MATNHCASVAVPLYVDLDGTIVHTDLLIESALQVLRTRPWALLKLPIWLLRGKAYLKSRMAELGPVSVALLPYNRDLLAYLEKEFQQGRPLVLATGASSLLAGPVAEHLGFFAHVLGTTPTLNLSGANKLNAIRAHSGGSFAYAGNGADDLPIWQASAAAVLVSVSRRVESRLPRGLPIEAAFYRHSTSHDFWTLLRPHHWLKNVLVFLPLLPIATSMTATMFASALLAFVAFSMCASAGYIANDLLDLEADRSHPTKHNRPLAAGRVSLVTADFTAVGLTLCAVGLALILPRAFIAVLVLYLAGTLFYSLKAKVHALIDVVGLAGLYVLRVIGGAAAIDIPPSFWVLAFSFFTFVSLALAKRYTELLALANRSTTRKVDRRGYFPKDLSFVQTIGIAAGQSAVVLMALYVNDPAVSSHYSNHALLWTLCPLLFVWIGRVWLVAGRGQLHEDPLMFALTDRLCLLVAGLVVLVVLAALFFDPRSAWLPIGQ